MSKSINSFSKEEKIKNIVNYILEKAKTEEYVIIDLPTMAKITKTTSVQDYQLYRYAVCINYSEIFMELVNRQGEYRSRAKLPYGFKILSKQDIQDFSVTENCFRFLTEKQICYILEKLPKDIVNSKSALLSALYMIDLFLIKNNKNLWCVVNKRYYSSGFMMQEEIVRTVTKILIDAKILVMKKINNILMFRVAFSDEDYDKFLSEGENDNPYCGFCVPIGFYPKKNKDILNSITGDNPESRHLSTLDNDQAIVRNNDIEAAIDILKNTIQTNINELQGKIKDLESQQETTKQNMEKDFKVFDKLNSINQENEAKILKLQEKADKLDRIEKNHKAWKSGVEQSIKRNFNKYIAKISDLLANYNSSYNSQEDLKGDILVHTLNTRSFMLNLLTTADLDKGFEFKHMVANDED